MAKSDGYSDADGHLRQDLQRPIQRDTQSSSTDDSAKITHARRQLVPWRVGDLRPHPGYARLGIKVSASRLNALIEMGEDAFLFPLIITSKGIVIDGYARLEVARLQGRATVECVEYDISEEETLRRLLLCHRPTAEFPGLPGTGGTGFLHGVQFARNRPEVGQRRQVIGTDSP
jgi:hypothetical protein